MDRNKTCILLLILVDNINGCLNKVFESIFLQVICKDILNTIYYVSLMDFFVVTQQLSNCLNCDNKMNLFY